MAEQFDVNMGFTPAFEARLDHYFLSMGLGVNAYSLKRDRKEILYWFNSKSDAELALIGLHRRDIPAFVFRDLFGT